MKDSYLTVKKNTVSEFKAGKSVFIAQSFRISSTAEALEKIKSVRKKYYDASHHPFAYRLGVSNDSFRYSDDGEPQGSSGIPILEMIDKYRLTDTLVIVSRYFGGIKLGVGGLRRAMAEAAGLCLKNSESAEVLITENVMIEFDYKYMSGVMNLIETEKIKLTQNISDEKCKLILEVRLSIIKKLRTELQSVTNGSIKYT
ncbi:MAG: YigZ family protein [Ignavibacteria bacterium]|nr:YigZ family protein [Ignavibacteria bacterium]